MRSHLLVCTILFVSACSKSSSEGSPAKVLAKSQPVTRVAVATVKRVPLSSELAITAEFRPDQEVDVRAKVTGYLKKIEVDVGDRVASGQLLATIEIPEMDDDLARNAASITRSQAELARAGQDLKRAETVREMTQLSYSRLASVLDKRPGLVAQQEIDTVRNQDLVAQSQIGSAKAALAVAEQSIKVLEAEATRIRTLQNYARVLSPFAGLVTKRYADNGAMIQAAPLVRIAQTHVLRLILPVPESAVPRLRVGGTVKVQVESINQTLTGRISRLSGQIQTSTRTMETEVDVPNPRGTLVPGMFAEARLRLEEKTQALSIPVDAVDHEKGQTSVLVVNAARTLEHREIVVGMETPERAEVKSGLAEGDLVVLGNRSQYKPGQKVDPQL